MELRTCFLALAASKTDHPPHSILVGTSAPHTRASPREGRDRSPSLPHASTLSLVFSKGIYS